MKDCWMHGPDDRPTFKDLVLALDKAIECNIPAMVSQWFFECACAFVYPKELWGFCLN